jgi:hypothetical protein
MSHCRMKPLKLFNDVRFGGTVQELFSSSLHFVVNIISISFNTLITFRILCISVRYLPHMYSSYLERGLAFPKCLGFVGVFRHNAWFVMNLRQILSSYLRLGTHFLSLSLVLHAPPISSSLTYRNNICEVQTLNHLITQFSPASCYLTCLRSIAPSSQTSSVSVLPFTWETILTPIQKHR